VTDDFGPRHLPQVPLLAPLSLAYLLFASTPACPAECRAGSPTTLAACLRSPDAVRVVIDSDIYCGEEANCYFRLVSRRSSFELVGAGAHRPGIYRQPGYRGRFGLLVDKSSGPILISNLIFDEGGSKPIGMPGGVWTNANCQEQQTCNDQTLGIVDSQNVMISNVAFHGAQNIALAVSGSAGITIRNSDFVGAWLYGVWFAPKSLSSDIHILHNRFQDIRSNAIMISAAPPLDTSRCHYNTVIKNVLNHNHHAAHFHVCGPNHDRPCGGGQVDVEQHSNRVLLYGNQILNGQVDEDSSLDPKPRTSGIEIAPADVHQILIFENQISDVSGHGIAIDWPVRDVDSIWVLDNRIEHVGAKDIDSLERVQPPVVGPPDWGDCEGVPAFSAFDNLRSSTRDKGRP
jgi:hypothetical protein